MSAASLLSGLGPLTLGGAGIWTLVAVVVVALIRLKPLTQKLKNEKESTLTANLMRRVGELEEREVKHTLQREEDRKACDAKTDALEATINGLQRQLIMFQVATGRALPPGTISPEIAEMMAMLAPLFGEQHGPKSHTLQAAEDACHATEVTREQVRQDEAIAHKGKTDDT